MKTTCNDDNPYQGLIIQYLNQEFPQISNLNQSDLIDILTNIIVSTKEFRYGPVPNPEGLVVIREAIRNAVSLDRPIPVLVPWGSIKSDFKSKLDIAEVSAINRLVQLSKAVNEVYPKGLEIVIRVENTSGYTLFTMEADSETIHTEMDSYTKDFCNLVTILSEGYNIRTIKESEMEKSSDFNTQFDSLVPLFERYLTDSDELINFTTYAVTSLDSYNKLSELGWKGIISAEQRNHYYESYKKIYKDWDKERLIKRLSLYLAGSFTRHLLQMTGKQEYWDNKFIQLSFVPPIKGLPVGYNYNYIYYRTLPMSQARTHICPWRAKGYLKITNNHVCAKIASFNDTEVVNEFIESEIVLSNESYSVTINTNYLLTD